MSELCTSRCTFLIGFCLAILGIANRPVYGVSLQTALNGASITIANARFDNWELISIDATSGLVPDLTQVEVVLLGNDPANPGVQIQGNGQFTTTGLNAMELEFRFRVSALAGGNSFTGHSLSMTGINIGGSGGIANISQEAVTPFGDDLGPAFVFANDSDNDFLFNSSSPFATQSAFTVTTNIFITGIGPLDATNLTSFSQRFAQTGPAGLLGDYDNDGDVDAADYTRWRDNLGSTAVLPNDPSPGAVTQEDYDTWKAHFGLTGGAGAGAVQTVAVPEPKSLVMLLVAVLSMCRWRCVRH